MKWTIFIIQVEVGTSYVFLDARKPDCMLKECNLGNVATDAFVFHYAKQFARESQWTTASVAIQNSGSITSSMFVNAKGTVCYDLNSQGFTPEMDTKINWPQPEVLS